MALSAMLQLGLPHLNILTKCDLVSQDTLDKFRFPDGDALLSRMQDKKGCGHRDDLSLIVTPFTRLNYAISSLVAVMPTTDD